MFYNCLKMISRIVDFKELVINVEKENVNIDVDKKLNEIKAYCDNIFDRIREIEDLLDQ